MKKKLFVILPIIAILSLGLLFGIALTSGLFGKGSDLKEAKNLEYALSYDGNYYIVSGLGEEKRTAFKIPKLYNGKPVKIIEDGAFKDCKNLTSITIPNSVTSIGFLAFYGCSKLKSVTIENGVTDIGYDAFRECIELTSVTIPSSVSCVSKGAFRDCKKLESVTIGSGTTSIGDGAFNECYKLKSLTIGNGVADIGQSAFFGCKSLTRIDFNGTLQQWETVHKGDLWITTETPLTVYCVDGTISNEDA